MSSYLRSATAIAVALCLPACATVTRGTKQKFAIESTPVGAAVKLSTGQTCTTPCNLKLRRKYKFTATFTKEGYQPLDARVDSEVRGGGGAALAGNAVLGGLVGLVIDGTNGSMNDLRPNPLKVTLVPAEAAAPAAAAASEAPAEPSTAPAVASPSEAAPPATTGAAPIAAVEAAAGTTAAANAFASPTASDPIKQ